MAKKHWTIILVLGCIFLCGHFFRYEHESKACGNGCSYVWDRWRQRECVSVFEKGIACNSEEISKLFASPKELPTWDEAMAENQSKHSPSAPLNIIITFTVLLFVIIKRKTVGRFFKKLGYSLATKYYTLGIGAFMGSLVSSGMPSVLGYMTMTWPLRWLMSLFGKTPKK